MKIRAICPDCTNRIPRSWYIKFLAHVNRACPHCGATIRSNTKWEWISSVCLGILLAAPWLAVLIGSITWLMAIAIAIGTSLIGWIVFPYVTPFDLVEPPEEPTLEQQPGGDG
jgi:hypothetical protein